MKSLLWSIQSLSVSNSLSATATHLIEGENNRRLSKRQFPEATGTTKLLQLLSSGYTKITEQGETSALLNLSRILGGFSVTYFQVPWATKHGALQTFGCEAAAGAGLFLIIVPLLQIKGRYLRVSSSIMSAFTKSTTDRTSSASLLVLSFCNHDVSN